MKKKLRKITWFLALALALTATAAVLPVSAQAGRGGLIQQQQPGAQGAIIRNVPTRTPGGGLTPTPSPNPAPNPQPQPNPGLTPTPGGGVINNMPIGNPVATPQWTAVRVGGETWQQAMSNLNSANGLRDVQTPWWDIQTENQLIRKVGAGINREDHIEQPLIFVTFNPQTGEIGGLSVWVTKRVGDREVSIRYGQTGKFYIGTSAYVPNTITAPVRDWRSAVLPFANPNMQRGAANQLFGSPVWDAMQGYLTARKEEGRSNGRWDAYDVNPEFFPVAMLRNQLNLSLCLTCGKNVMYTGTQAVVDIKDVEAAVLREFPPTLSITLDTVIVADPDPVRQAGNCGLLMCVTSPSFGPNMTPTVGSFILER